MKCPIADPRAVARSDLTVPPEPLPQSVVEDQLVIGKNMTIKIDVYNAGDRYARPPFVL